MAWETDEARGLARMLDKAQARLREAEAELEKREEQYQRGLRAQRDDYARQIAKAEAEAVGSEEARAALDALDEAIARLGKFAHEHESFGRSAEPFFYEAVPALHKAMRALGAKHYLVVHKTPGGRLTAMEWAWDQEDASRRASRRELPVLSVQEGGRR